MLLHVLFLFLVSLVRVFSLPAARLPRDGPVLPTDDPFYQPPSGFESTSPGTILRYRTPPYPIAAFGTDPVNLAAAYQILYRTTDSFGNATATVSTILIPNNADNTKLLSYQVAEDAADPNCAPSYAFQYESATGGPLGLLMPQLELFFIETIINNGWIATIPDFLGPKAAFLANNLAGYAVLDNIRAALASSNFTNIASNPTITMWGYSGGSLATGFAAELQPSYAPELEIAGAALGGTVPQILPVINSVNKGPYAGLIPSGTMGLANEYSEIVTLLDQKIVPSKMAALEQAANMCLVGDIERYAGQDIYNYTTDPHIFTEATATQVLDANNMGQNAPTIPLFIYKSAGDEVSPVSNTDSLVSYYCASGSNVEYKRDESSDHATMAIIGAPDAMIWLNERMRGVPVTPVCTNTTELTDLTDPGALAVLGVDLVEILLDLLQDPVSPIMIG
ncbi:hypothetical protein VTN77DRAFT_3457 [Rasamsonia byssochlamydoides]|uniref:uncharacterized protein n=1 Tax=Rasamsonia byssochlamydoides TaxID=89139 RepID=UPI003743BBD0